MKTIKDFLLSSSFEFEIGQLLLPIAIILMVYAIGLFDKRETAWIFQWKYWKRLILMNVALILYTFYCFYKVYKIGICF